MNISPHNVKRISIRKAFRQAWIFFISQNITIIKLINYKYEIGNKYTRRLGKDFIDGRYYIIAGKS